MGLEGGGCDERKGWPQGGRQGWVPSSLGAVRGGRRGCVWSVAVGRMGREVVESRQGKGRASCHAGGDGKEALSAAPLRPRRPTDVI